MDILREKIYSTKKGTINTTLFFDKKFTLIPTVAYDDFYGIKTLSFYWLNYNYDIDFVPWKEH